MDTLFAKYRSCWQTNGNSKRFSHWTIMTTVSPVAVPSPLASEVFWRKLAVFSMLWHRTPLLVTLVIPKILSVVMELQEPAWVWYEDLIRSRHQILRSTNDVSSYPHWLKLTWLLSIRRWDCRAGCFVSDRFSIFWSSKLLIEVNRRGKWLFDDNFLRNNELSLSVESLDSKYLSHTHEMLPKVGVSTLIRLVWHVAHFWPEIELYSWKVAGSPSSWVVVSLL